MNTIAKLRRDTEPLRGTFVVDGLGTFSLRPVHPSWVQSLLLGATDYYGDREVRAEQVVPDEAHWTIDVPDMTRENTPANENKVLGAPRPTVRALTSACARRDARDLRVAPASEVSPDAPPPIPTLAPNHNARA